ncbi:hypothetical protein [Hyalangium versicolor]|uniref:hypothetical protein n=1 Tax=Hyalangium versicolor TaxID=2861190 RepID=UPI001CCAB281|nr:hypothetical protein [Hyalangium versicolor]
MKELFLKRMRAQAPWPFEPRHIQVLCRGNAGCAEALGIAQRWIDHGLDRVVILATDSYLDPFTLEWLDSRHRLKTGERPVGLMPGEAGACVMIESRRSAARRKAPILAKVDAVSRGQEPRHFFQSTPSVGEGLAAVTAACLDGISSGVPFNGDIVLDLNGEEWRAREWGNALLRLRERLGDSIRWILPGSSWGDIGAASGVAGMCIAARSLARGYAKASQVLVLSSSEWGNVSAILLKQER